MGRPVKQISIKTNNLLSAFGDFTEKILLTPSGRFLVFCQIPNATLLIEGRCKEKFSEFATFNTSHLKQIPVIFQQHISTSPFTLNDSLDTPEMAENYWNKFAGLLDGCKEIASFQLEKKFTRLLKRNVKKFSNIRIWNDTEEYEVNICGYEKIAKKKYGGELQLTLQNSLSNNFSIIVNKAAFSELKDGSYEIAIFHNNIVTFNSIEKGWTYYAMGAVDVTEGCFMISLV